MKKERGPVDISSMVSVLRPPHVINTAGSQIGGFAGIDCRDFGAVRYTNSPRRSS